MNLHLDTRVFVVTLIRYPFADRAYRYLIAETPGLTLIDFAAAAFASAAARRVRMNELTENKARKAFLTFDGLAPRAVERIETAPADLKSAESFLRRLDLPLRAPDALHSDRPNSSMPRL